MRVKAFGPGASVPAEPTASGGLLFFRLADPAAGPELWASDGTGAGTFRVKDIRPGPAGSLPARLTSVGSVLFFRADDGATGTELWKSDGTAAGTALVQDMAPGADSSFLRGVAAAGGLLFFGAYDGDGYVRLWRSDGTGAGTFEVQKGLSLDDSSTFEELRLAAVGDVVYFSGDDGEHGRELWVSDGSEEGTRTVFDLIAGISSRPEEMVDLAGRLFFRVESDPEGRCALWRSDGTGEGTVSVPDAAGGGAVCPRELTPLGGTLFFAGRDRSGFEGLWKSDGATAVQVSDGAGAIARMGELERAGGLVLFSACGPATGCEPWRSDGTAAGTALLADLVPGPEGSGPEMLTEANGLVFFRADAGPGPDLWRSDGTAAGTFALRDRGDRPRGFVDFHGLLFFLVDAAGGDEVWKSDGTRAGTHPVFLGYGAGTIEELTVSGGALYYFVRRDEGVDLWKGEASQAARVTTFPPEARPEELGAAGGLFFFSLSDPAAGREPWVSDGTEAGTHRVKDLFPGPGSSLPRHLGEAFGRAVFAASDGFRGLEVWLSDGTEAGTFQLPDIAPGGRSSSPRDFTVSRGSVFFSADDTRTGRELWAFTVRTNAPPVLASLAVSPVPAAQGTPVTLSATFLDPDEGDLHTARIDWGDGTTTAGHVIASPSGGMVDATHIYAAPGLYPVTLTVTDAAGESDLRVFRHAVVHAPNGPFVTGSGWIGTGRGRASFQLQALYKKGSSVPQGSLRFRLPGLDLRSQSLSWLVVSGAAAWIEGQGTIDGQGSYRFRAALVDGQAPGGGGADRFRILIQSLATGAVVYDTEPGAPDDAPPTAALGGGAIQLHRRNPMGEPRRRGRLSGSRRSHALAFFRRSQSSRALYYLGDLPEAARPCSR